MKEVFEKWLVYDVCANMSTQKQMCTLIMCLPPSIYMTNVTNHTRIVTKIWLHFPPMKMFEKMFGSNLLPIKDMVDLNNVVQFLLFG